MRMAPDRVPQQWRPCPARHEAPTYERRPLLRTTAPEFSTPGATSALRRAAGERAYVARVVRMDDHRAAFSFDAAKHHPAACGSRLRAASIESVGSCR
jgi:hypothetical protein